MSTVVDGPNASSLESGARNSRSSTCF